MCAKRLTRVQIISWWCRREGLDSVRAKVRTKLYPPTLVQSQIAPANPYGRKRGKRYVPRDYPRPQPNPQFSIGVKDSQTEEERAFREKLARAEEVRFQKALANARADGSRCIEKACASPAVLEGKCRQHAMDAHAEMSLIPSNMTVAMGIVYRPFDDL